MSGVTKHAALEVRTRNGGKFESSGETFVTLRIVVLESDLDLNGFGEVTLLSLEFFATLFDGATFSEGEAVFDAFVEEGRVQFVGHG